MTGTIKTCFCIQLLAALPTCGQGTFIDDQQSADENTGGGVFIQIQSSQPIGQSFTPTNSSVDFIRLGFSDSVLNGTGATVYVNLRSNAINGTILGSTDPVFMADGFGVSFRGFTNFFFSVPVLVTPGVVYYLQPVVQSGDPTWSITAYHYGYPGGTEFVNGVANANFDLWFREGIFVVPEPSSFALLVGSGALFYAQRKKMEMRSAVQTCCRSW